MTNRFANWKPATDRRGSSDPGPSAHAQREAGMTIGETCGIDAYGFVNRSRPTDSVAFGVFA